MRYTDAITKQTNYVTNKRELDQILQSKKWWRCIFCKHRGTLNLHDKLYYYDVTEKKLILKGQRCYCSKRGKRGGCGRTIVFIFTWVLPRHSYTSEHLWTLLEEISKGRSIMKGIMKLPSIFSDGGAYHILQRLRKREGCVRERLLQICSPPRSSRVDSLAQSAEHLRSAFPEENDPIQAFQKRFQVPLMG